eukprot:GHUV01034687.1.p1 GENE.GHUV01034687.1~~GHUV01034687.1.p1  ORF type:complete len:111 (-),score=15.04 GHUV01034687.1:170-502(-)
MSVPTLGCLKLAAAANSLCCFRLTTLQEFAASMSTQIAGFDNVALSMLSVFQAMTLSNWSFTMYRTMDFLSPALVIYWVILIIFGAFFVVSLQLGNTAACLTLLVLGHLQ